MNLLYSSSESRSDSLHQSQVASKFWFSAQHGLISSYKTRVKAIIPFVLLLITLAALLSGCSDTGHTFNYKAVTNLELGKTQVSDCKVMFGFEPNLKSEITNADGVFDLCQYAYAHDNLKSDCVHVVALEFKDGRLNAFDYVSNFDKENKLVLLENASQIKKNASTKADVLKILGIPSGKAICPSMLFILKCDKCVEVWSWKSLSGISDFASNNGYTPELRTINVSFDKSDVVSEVEITKTSN